MRIYLPIAVLIAILSAYYWVWQSSAAQVREEVTQWIESERASGRIAEHAGFRIRGFPYRMQIEILEPHLADPAAGWSWQAEKITGFVLPYRINHAVLVVEGDQRLEFSRLGRREIITGRAEDQRISLVLRGGDLERFALDTSGIRATREIYLIEQTETLERTEEIEVEQLSAHSRRIRDSEGLPDVGRHYALVIEGEGIVWNGHPYDGLGSDISFVLARIIVTGLPDTGIIAISSDLLPLWHQNGGILYLDEAAIRWSEIELGGTGVFELDDQNRIEGEMTVLISGHDRAIDALVAGGALDPEYAEISKTVLDVIAAIGGDPEGRIRAPLRLEDGTVFLGPAQVMELQPLY